MNFQLHSYPAHTMVNSQALIGHHSPQTSNSSARCPVSLPHWPQNVHPATNPIASQPSAKNGDLVHTVSLHPQGFQHKGCLEQPSPAQPWLLSLQALMVLLGPCPIVGGVCSLGLCSQPFLLNTAKDCKRSSPHPKNRYIILCFSDQLISSTILSWTGCRTRVLPANTAALGRDGTWQVQHPEPRPVWRRSPGPPGPSSSE